MITDDYLRARRLAAKAEYHSELETSSTETPKRKPKRTQNKRSPGHTCRKFKILKRSQDNAHSIFSSNSDSSASIESDSTLEPSDLVLDSNKVLEPNRGIFEAQSPGSSSSLQQKGMCLCFTIVNFHIDQIKMLTENRLISH